MVKFFFFLVFFFNLEASEYDHGNVLTQKWPVKFVNEEEVSIWPDGLSWRRHNASTTLLSFQPFLGRGPFHIKYRQKMGDEPPPSLYESRF